MRLITIYLYLLSLAFFKEAWWGLPRLYTDLQRSFCCKRVEKTGLSGVCLSVINESQFVNTMDERPFVTPGEEQGDIVPLYLTSVE